MADYDWFPERYEAERQRADKERINLENGFYTEYEAWALGGVVPRG